jgi:hypothetical protein
VLTQTNLTLAKGHNKLTKMMIKSNKMMGRIID